MEGVGEVGSLEDNCHGADELRPLKLEPLFKTPSATTTAPGLTARGKLMDALCNVYLSVQKEVSQLGGSWSSAQELDKLNRTSPLGEFKIRMVFYP